MPEPTQAQREAAVAKLIRRGELSPEKATAAGFGALAQQVQSGFYVGRMSSGDRVQDRANASKDYAKIVADRGALKKHYGQLAQLDRFLDVNTRAKTGPIFSVPLVGDWVQQGSPELSELSGIASTLQGEARPEGSGATSDFEQRLYRMGVPSPEKFGTTNQNLIASRRALIAEENDRVAFQEAYYRRNNSLVGAAEAWASYTRANPYALTSKEGISLNRRRQDWRSYFGVQGGPRVVAPVGPRPGAGGTGKAPPPRKPVPVGKLSNDQLLSDLGL